MSIKIRVDTALYKYFEDPQVAEVNGKTVGQCLEDLIKQLPSLKLDLFDQNGKLFSYVDIYVNGERIYLEKLEKPTKDGDELHIINMFGADMRAMFD